MHWTTPMIVIGLLLGLGLGIYFMYTGLSYKNSTNSQEKSNSTLLIVLGVVFLLFAIICFGSLFIQIRSNKVAPSPL